MGSSSKSKVQKKNRSSKTLPIRSRPTIAMKIPRHVSNTAVARPVVDKAENMGINRSTANIDPQPGSSKEVAMSINHESAKIASSSTINADGSDSSRTVSESDAVLEVTENLEPDLDNTKTKTKGVIRPIGITQKDMHGNVFWRETDTEDWKRAVYHSDIRNQLIAACNQEGQYLYRRDAGHLPSDVTAFHKAQQDWGFKRHQRPEILHQYQKAGHKNPTYSVPIWIHNGNIVLDHEDHPILAFRNMPATISTKVEGGLQEAITREDSRIDVKDFRARMMENPKSKGKRRSTRPSLSAISMRRSRFRWRAGYLSWTTRTGSGDIKEYLDSLLPDECKLSNSTKGFRELKRSEVKLMTEKNRGKHLKRAGPRSITAEKRTQMDAAFYKSIEDAKAQEEYVEAEQEYSGEDDEDYESDGPEEESLGFEDQPGYSTIEYLQEESVGFEDQPGHSTIDYLQAESVGFEDQPGHSTIEYLQEASVGFKDQPGHSTIVDLQEESLGFENLPGYSTNGDLLEYYPDADVSESDDEDDAVEPRLRRKPKDIRFVKPKSEAEGHIIFHSMQPTRLQFHQFTGLAPLVYCAKTSYAKQWAYLHSQLVQTWSDYRYLGPLPGLIQTEKHAWINKYPEIEITEY